MSTTDRITQLDTQRTITDRLGETVTLGNSVSGATLNVIAAAVMTASSKSEVHVPMSLTAVATIDWANASFGDWFSDWDSDAVSSLQTSGASVASVPFADVTASLLTWGADAMLLNIQVITSTQAYTPTAGTAKVVVLCLGAGGGGGGAPATTANLSCGGGGGAGALAMGIITSGFSGVTITIGAGGAGGAAGANAGTAGGATTFGTVLSGGGGGGGGTIGPSAALVTATAGASGSASGSSSLYGAIGERGTQGICYTGSYAESGRGASSNYGSGGISDIRSASAGAGAAATGFGAGGAGAVSAGTSAAAAGGNGSAGICIVYEYNA